jgi:hypothetical protein
MQLSKACSIRSNRAYSSVAKASTHSELNLGGYQVAKLIFAIPLPSTAKNIRMCEGAQTYSKATDMAVKRALDAITVFHTDLNEGLAAVDAGTRR